MIILLVYVMFEHEDDIKEDSFFQPLYQQTQLVQNCIKLRKDISDQVKKYFGRAGDDKFVWEIGFVLEKSLVSRFK